MARRIEIDAATNGTTFNMDTIKNKFVEKVKELENTTEIEFPTGESETRLDGTYKGYEFYIDDKYAAHIGDKATGISLTTSIKPSGWTQGPVTATITIKSNNGINKVEPDEGSKNGNEYIITKENIAENTSFKYTVTDGQGNTQTKTVEINTIDKKAPADFTIAAENTEEGLRITGTTTDAESGIDKYEYYAKKSDGEYKAYDSNPITGLASGTYNVYAIAYDKAGNKKQSTNTVENVKISASYSNVTAAMVASDPAKYYGLKVTDYTSQNGQNDWKIFYSDWKENPDDAHIFLITGDCVDLSVDGRLNENTKMTMISKYIADWKQKDIPDEMQLVPDETLELFKATEYKLKSKNQNSICVSTLLNSENWQGYLDTNNEKAKEAIGGPTIEMWSLSWNSKYPSDKIYYKADKEGYGYFIGENEDPIKNYSVNNSQKKGYNDVLYNVSLVNSNTKNRIYWISSPSADEDVRLYYNIVGNIASNRNTVNAVGIRPVVSLKKDITVDAKDSE